MDDDSLVDRLLVAFAAAFDTESKRYDGACDHVLWNGLDAALQSEGPRRLGDTFERARKEKLLRRSDLDWEHIILTPAGWDRVPGGMPGHSNDESFLAATHELWTDSSTRRWRGRLLASTVYGELGWPFDGAEAGNIARRLAAQGLLDHLEIEGDALVRPKGG